MSLFGILYVVLLPLIRLLPVSLQTHLSMIPRLNLLVCFIWVSVLMLLSVSYFFFFSLQVLYIFFISLSVILLCVLSIHLVVLPILPVIVLLYLVLVLLFLLLTAQYLLFLRIFCLLYVLTCHILSPKFSRLSPFVTLITCYPASFPLHYCCCCSLLYLFGLLFLTFLSHIGYSLSFSYDLFCSFYIFLLPFL